MTHAIYRVKSNEYAEVCETVGTLIVGGIGLVSTYFIGEQINDFFEITNTIGRIAVYAASIITLANPASGIGGYAGMYLGRGAGYMIDRSIEGISYVSNKINPLRKKRK